MLTKIESLLIASATETRTNVRIATRSLLNPETGKVKVAYASFRLPSVATTFAEVVSVLTKLGSTVVNVTLPKMEDGIVSISLRPVYTAVTLAKVLADYAASTEPKKAEIDPVKMTVNELRELLRSRSVAFPEGAKKGELLALAMPVPNSEAGH